MADDIVIFTRDTNIKEIKKRLQESIDSLIKWTKETGFKFSPTKTQAVNFNKKKKDPSTPNLYIEEHIIKFEETAKFLGVTLDKKLTWKPHIMKLKTDCLQRMNIMKIIGHQKWGAHKTTLIQLYKALIQSKIDYCSSVYGKAKSKLLKILDPVLNSAIRIATGAFRSSPVDSVLCEAGVMPLRFRRDQQYLNQISKIATNPSLPIYSHFFPKNNNIYTINPTNKLHTENIKKNLNIKIPNLKRIILPKTPPWIRKTATIDTSFSQQNITTKEDILQHFQYLKHRYNRFTHIYTDGSRMDNKTGASVVLNHNNVLQYHLPEMTSVYTAEAFSIHKALEWIKEAKGTHHAIFTDSYSVIQDISRKFNSRNSTILEIQEIIHEIKNTGKIIAIIWVPAHKGIPGNERADDAAKKATYKRQTNCDIPQSDFKCTLRMKTRDCWTKEWKKIEPYNNKLRFLKNDTQPGKIRNNRREQIIMTRLRIGHTRITHQHLFKREEQPICETCNETVTVQHLICNCFKYETIRDKLQIPTNINEALHTDNEEKLLQFLDETDLKNYI